MDEWKEKVSKSEAFTHCFYLKTKQKQKRFCCTHFKIWFVGNIKIKEKETKLLTVLVGYDNINILMSSFAVFVQTWWLVCFFLRLCRHSLYSDVYPALSVGANGSLFLFCNQLFINTTVNVFRLFQSGGCTIIYLIFPFCSTFWILLMNEVVDIFWVESFFWCLRWFPENDSTDAKGSNMPAVKEMDFSFFPEVAHCSFFQHNLEPSIRTKKNLGDESPVWLLSFDRGEYGIPEKGSESQGHTAARMDYQSANFVSVFQKSP